MRKLSQGLWQRYSPLRNRREVLRGLARILRQKSPRAEILSIGNELLIGHTLDTNSHWIAKRLLRLGWKLERITKLRDSLPEIRAATREVLERHPKVLITLGGLGPTHDDMTLKGIGLALNRPLMISPGALALVKQRYEAIEGKPDLTVYRRKMATLPRGALPLPNPVGTAPGVLMYTPKTTIFSLPGVPSEMKAIFTKFIVPFLKSTASTAPSEVQLRISGIIESSLAPILDKARQKYPALYFKSHPRGLETYSRPAILLHVYNTEPSAEKKIVQAVNYIIDKLSKTE